MTHRDGFWKLGHLSKAQLLERLGNVLRTHRCSLAEVVAHLGEVEDRRLHLEAAHSSMFAYCVSRLGMSEDEACRRIELARLARRFPALFAELASGQITLSVALVLKPVLSPTNHMELFCAARGKNIRQARELVAERFPKPDAPSSIRKLPERRAAQADLVPGACAPAPSEAGPLLPYVAPSSLASPSTEAAPSAAAPTIPPLTVPVPAEPSTSTGVLAARAPVSSAPAQPSLAPSAPACPAPADPEARSPVPRSHFAPPVSRGSVEPLSAGRYRIQFTADAALKQQLDLARNLLRHAHPTGDLAPIVSRALKLLIDDLLRQRFGAVKRSKAACPASALAASTPSSAPEPPAAAAPAPATVASASPAPAKAAHSPSPAPATSASAVSAPPAVASAAPASRAPIPRPARRAVFERDGLGCSWLDANGVRCGNQAWLEFDHRHPAGKGGSCEPENLRLLCRSHNGLAAEHAYGRRHIEQALLRRQNGVHPLNSQPGG